MFRLRLETESPGSERSAALLRTLRRIPPFHPVATRLIRMASVETTPLVEIANLIRSDAAFSAEVLRLANSPLFGMMREVSSIMQAVALLGLQRVRALASTVALRQFLARVAHARAARLCWRHNLATALLAEEFASAALLDRDTAYTCGLMHDLGRLALLTLDPDAMEAIVDRADSAGADPGELERHAYGASHTEAGAWIMEHWDFPPLLRSVACAHHRPPAPPFEIPAAVGLACRVADALGFQFAGPAPDWEWEQWKPLLPQAAATLLDRGRQPLLELVAIRINAFECAM